MPQTTDKVSDQMDPEAPTLFGEIGGTGLKIYSGTVSEEFLASLDSTAGIRTYSEMRDNSDIVGAFIWAIRQLVRGTQWRIESPDDTGEHSQMSDLLMSSIDDMSHTWQEFMDEVLSMIVFGWSMHEIVLKKRNGRTFDPDTSSRYRDNMIGIAKLPIRAQETLLRFHTDPNLPEKILGMEQQIPTDGRTRIIPRGKLLHFRPSAYKGNPLGRSMLRNAYVAYYYSKKIQEIEAIGVERDLTGIPVVYAPSRLFKKSPSPDDVAILGRLRQIVASIRQDTHKGILMPAERDSSGNLLFDLKLLSTGGSRQFDTDKIARRYDQKIATSVLADFLVLGHNSVGSFALSNNKTSLFLSSIVAVMDAIEQTLNRELVPVLMRVNGWQNEDEVPAFRHGGATDIDSTTMVEILTKLSAAGMPLFPDPVLEDSIRERFNLPKASAESTKIVGSEDGSSGTDGEDKKDEKPEAEKDEKPEAEKDEKKETE
jgi:hypothetical protein